MSMKQTSIRIVLFSLLTAMYLFCAPPASAAESYTAEDYEWGGEYAMVLPDMSGSLTEFSETHPALDLTAESGSAVLAAEDGTVNAVQTEDAPFTQASAAYGNMIRVIHPDGNQTLYAHLDTILVSDGDTVSRGQVIGTVGTTGDAEEPMLHFEVIEPLMNADPTPYLTGITTYTQAELSDIQKDISGGTKYISDYGTIDRTALIKELQSHENDKFYLNTPYHGGDWQSPTGDTAYNGEAGMNCAGFISYVLRKTGLDADAAMDAITENRYFDWKSDRPYSILASASNYFLWAKNGDLVCYVYETMDDLLKAGKAAKGDLILYYVNQGWLLTDNEDNHLVFFWGDTPSENLIWHQANIGITDANGNTTNQIIPSTYYIDTAKYILIKIDKTEYTLESPVITASNDSATGAITLKWNAVDGAAKYDIYRSSSENGKYIKLSSRTETTYTNVSVTPGKKYYYKVKAVTADGCESKFSNVAARTRDLARPVVTASNDPATGAITLKWKAIDGAVEYEIYRSSSEDGKYTKLSSRTGTTYTNVSVTPGKKYYYKVKAICSNSAANSADSIPAARTCDLSRPVVTASNDPATGAITLKWKAIDGAVKYEIYRSSSENGKYTKLSSLTGTTYTNVSVTPGKKYYYKVKAICSNSAANSADSIPAARTRDLARPVVTASSNPANGAITLNWKAIDGTVKYEIYRSTSENGSYIKLSSRTGTTYTNVSVTPGKKYYYKVKAIHTNTAANSAFSSPVSAASKQT